VSGGIVMMLCVGNDGDDERSSENVSPCPAGFQTTFDFKKD